MEKAHNVVIKLDTAKELATATSTNFTLTFRATKDTFYDIYDPASLMDLLQAPLWSRAEEYEIELHCLRMLRDMLMEYAGRAAQIGNKSTSGELSVEFRKLSAKAEDWLKEFRRISKTWVVIRMAAG
ncbi:MAG: hypothetical protein Q9218_004019 [Villophora microphyllina]